MARFWMDSTLTDVKNACAVCGRAVKNINAKRVYLSDSCCEAITTDEPDFDGLSAPVGSECEKKIPEAFFI